VWCFGLGVSGEVRVLFSFPRISGRIESNQFEGFGGLTWVCLGVSFFWGDPFSCGLVSWVLVGIFAVGVMDWLRMF